MAWRSTYTPSEQNINEMRESHGFTDDDDFDPQDVMWSDVESDGEAAAPAAPAAKEAARGKARATKRPRQT